MIYLTNPYSSVLFHNFDFNHRQLTSSLLMQDAGVSKVNSKEIVMVWCTISDKEINCPYFFEENVTQNFPLNLRTANNFSNQV